MANDIYHHGVKGQKWGIRRTDAQLGHKTSNKRRDRSDRNDRKSEDAEIWKALASQYYSKQSSKQSSPLVRGRQKAGQILRTYGPMVAKAAAITALSAVGGTYVAMFASATINQVTGVDLQLPGIESHSTYDHSNARIEMGPIRKVR